MTGIERLREFVAGVSPFTVVCGVTRATYDEEHAEVLGVRLRDFLSEIADQIEREQDKVAKTDWDTVRKVSADMADRVFMSATIDELLRDWSRKLNDATDGHVVSDEREARAPFSRMRILAVVTDMERHVLGHEGMEDSPVARWARELRGALDGRDEEEVTDVATVRKDAMEAYEWVCEHGGLSHVKDIYHDLRAVVERLGVEWSESELHGLMGVLDRRLMPEGMEWLRYDTGEPVPLCGEVTVTVHDEDGDFDRTLAIRSIKYKENGVLLEGTKNEMVVLSHGERVRRPAPKVTAGDGRPLVVGEFVWHKSGVVGGVVESVDATSLMHTVRYRSRRGEEYRDAARDLVHDFPDSWERWVEDSKLHPSKYVDRYRVGRIGYEELDMNRDLVRRAKALAERGA